MSVPGTNSIPRANVPPLQVYQPPWAQATDRTVPSRWVVEGKNKRDKLRCRKPVTPLDTNMLKMDGRRCHSSNSFLYLLLLWSFFLILVLRLASHSKFNSSNPALPLPLWQLVPSTQGMQITGKFGGRKKQKQQKNEFFPEKFWSIWKITLTDMIRNIFSPFRESLLCATMLLTFAYVREVVLTILAALEFLIGRQQ